MEISGYMPKLFNMSITGGIIILVVLLARLCLKKAPKIFSYILWIVVLARLLCPVSVSTPFSILNLLSQKTVKSGRIEYIPERVTKADHPFQTLNIPVPDIDETDAGLKPTYNHNNRLAKVSAFELYGAAAFIWLIGFFGLLIYGNVQFVWLKERLVGAMHIRDNIYIADHIDSPFVMGFVRPKIYLPSSLSDTERDYIILHEQHHIKRFDHITRIATFLALCIHWFNPLVWVAFVLSGTDMEMSCDEAVMKSIGEDIREDYSRSLISFATGRRIISGTPLAFGEGSTKGRIKNVMSYKKPAFWVIILAMAVCVITSGCVLTNPAKEEIREAGFEPDINNGADGVDVNYDIDDEFEYLPEEYIIEEPATAEASVIASPVPSKQQLAIREAIIRHNYSRSLYPEDYNVPCASFIEFAAITTDMASDSISEIVTYYGLALYEQFKVSDDGIESGGASHGPVGLTFEIDKSGEYNLTEYWEPRDGIFYAQDIREKFPDETAEDALNLQKYILPQEIDCYAQAVDETEIDTDKIIENLIFKAMTGSQLSVFDPAKSVFENYPYFSSEHKEMLHYGFYTLKYCFERLENDEDNGAGYFMMTVCKDIAEAMGEEPLNYNAQSDGTVTGKQMYGLFINNAISLSKQYSRAELSEKYPASFYLLKLIGYIKPDTVTTHVYKLDSEIPKGSIVHVCSRVDEKNRKLFYLYYKDDKPVLIKHMSTALGLIPDDEEIREGFGRDGFINTDKGEIIDAITRYDMANIDISALGTGSISILQDQKDWSWEAVKKTFAENGYSCDEDTNKDMLFYIKGLAAEYIWLDEIEWVQVPSRRANELNITDEDAPGGFYIYNEDTETCAYKFSNRCKIMALDPRMNSGNITEMSFDLLSAIAYEYSEYFKNSPFHAVIKNGEVVELMQWYTP